MSKQKSFISLITKGPLGKNLVALFLIISIIPIALLSAVNYYTTHKAIKKQIVGSLYESVESKESEINAYFSGMLIDLDLQAKSEKNSRILQNLIDTFEQNGKPIAEFVKSYQCIKIAQHQCRYLRTIKEMKGYLNIYLIDRKGNILFTVENEDTLGINIFHTDTLFAKSCKNTLETGRPSFSDFEFNKYSNNKITGFLADVILNEVGDKIGLIAFQVDPGRMDKIVSYQDKIFTSYDIYLVGTDLKMRSNSILDKEKRALLEVVKTEQTKLWREEHDHGHKKKNIAIDEETPIIYSGRKGYKVIGLHKNIDIADVPMGIIAELNVDEAFAQLKLLKNMALFSLLTICALLFFLAILQTKIVVIPIKEFQSQLIQAEKLSGIGQLSAGVVHELNNPMMGILNYIQYCLKHIPTEDKKYSVLKDAEREINRCTDIVKNILTFSRMEKAGDEGRRKANYSDIIERVLKLLSYRFLREQILVIKDYNEGPHEGWMWADQIQQVILNLINNSIDALKDKNKKEIRISMHNRDKFVKITIEDTGAGIVPDDLSRISDPFFTTKIVGQGTGLGLSISYDIIKKHGGQIMCESKIGEGTKFTILLPCNRRRAENSTSATPDRAETITSATAEGSGIVTASVLENRLGSG